jgi:hypothetical protein
VLGEKFVPVSHFNHKFHMNCSGIRPEAPQSEDGDKLPELWHDHIRFLAKLCVFVQNIQANVVTNFCRWSI